jgi:hypothetical protein
MLGNYRVATQLVATVSYLVSQLCMDSTHFMRVACSVHVTLPVSYEAPPYAVQVVPCYVIIPLRRRTLQAASLARTSRTGPGRACRQT